MSWEKMLKIDTNTIDWNKHSHIADAVDTFMEAHEDFIDYEANRAKEQLKEVVDDAYNQVSQEDLDNPEFDMTELLHELSKDLKLNFKMQEELQ
jgi:hypothetical protein